MKYFNRNEQISIAPLVVFRLLFGLLTLFGTIRFLSKGWVDEMYIQPHLYFGFYGFEWIKTLPGDWMYLPFILMILGSLGIIFGFFTFYASDGTLGVVNLGSILFAFTIGPTLAFYLKVLKVT